MKHMTKENWLAWARGEPAADSMTHCRECAACAGKALLFSLPCKEAAPPQLCDGIEDAKAFHEGNLSPESLGPFMEHLYGCPVCKAYLALLSAGQEEQLAPVRQYLQLLVGASIYFSRAEKVSAACVLLEEPGETQKIDVALETPEKRTIAVLHLYAADKEAVLVRKDACPEKVKVVKYSQDQERVIVLGAEWDAGGALRFPYDKTAHLPAVVFFEEERLAFPIDSWDVYLNA